MSIDPTIAGTSARRQFLATSFRTERLQNVAARAYPTMLVESSYNDSQVMYWEPAKYVARLRTLKTDRNPLIFHIDMDPAGHGGKSGRYDQLRERAYNAAFVLWQLGVEKL